MSQKSDLFVSSPKAAQDYHNSQSASHQADLKHVTYVELSTLWAIAEKAPWEDRHMDDFELIHEENSGLVMTHRAPEAFVTLFAGLSSSAKNDAAEIWAQTEEIDCNTEEILPVIEDIIRLAKEAKSAKQGLYLWSSL